MQIQSNPLMPLCVDMDGTLLKTDVLWEGILDLAKRKPWQIFFMLAWLRKGRPYFKRQIAHRSQLDIASLPYSVEFIAFLKEERAQGRKLVLATAADKKIAEEVASHFAIFDQVVASEGNVNLRGHRKVEKLRELFGEKGFIYAGNEEQDLVVWEHSAASVVVNAPSRIEKKARQISDVWKVFSSPKFLPTLLKAMRVQQWVKNFLLFVPLLLAHRLGEGVLWGKTILAFLAFSFCASAVYWINDFWDLEADRHHGSKKKRPFASGDLFLMTGLLGIPLFLALSLCFSWLLPASFLLTLFLYFAVTLVYSFALKEVVLIDVFCLTFFYGIRLESGSHATGIAISPWLFMFALFFFLSLGFLKRWIELQSLAQENKIQTERRGYQVEDRSLVSQLGVSSGYLAVLVFAFYVQSEHVKSLYSHPERLWWICPILLYWLSHMWMLAHRGRMHDDPVLAAIREKPSYVCAFLSGMILWWGR